MPGSLAEEPMDPVALGTFLRDAGPWGLLALALLAIKFLVDYIKTLLEKIEVLNREWRADSQAQSDKLADVLSEQKGRSR